MFDLIYGELIPVESKSMGKICFIFYTVEEDFKPKIIYYPSTKELITLRDTETDFSQFIPLHTEQFKNQMSLWLESKFENEINFKGVSFIDFLSETFLTEKYLLR